VAVGAGNHNHRHDSRPNQVGFFVPASQPNQKGTHIMAVILQMTYQKKLGLPNFSSHSCAVSLTVEIPDVSVAAQESTKLYALLQTAVDGEIQHVGWMPDAESYGMKNGHSNVNGNGSATNGQRSNGNNGHHTAPARNGEAWSCTEGQLEDRLITRLQSFLLELGYGFCFVGRQHRIALGKKEYFIDLLFYHRFLKALVAFDLKVGPFEPEFAGKMDFYLNLLNDKVRGSDDQPSIGIILCAEKDDVEVEYALRTKANPIGVATYALQSKLPGELKGKLPTAKQLADIIRAEMEKG
jgi:hypothetical protein